MGSVQIKENKNPLKIDLFSPKLLKKSDLREISIVPNIRGIPEIKYVIIWLTPT
jgi:hypothetical protein